MLFVLGYIFFYAQILGAVNFIEALAMLQPSAELVQQENPLVVAFLL